MRRCLKRCLEVVCLPFVKHKRSCTAIVLINSIVLIVIGTVFFQFMHYSSSHMKSRLVEIEIQKYIENRELGKNTTASTKDKTDPKAFFSIPPVPKFSSNDFVFPLQPSIMEKFLHYKPRQEYTDKVVILTPIHNVARMLSRFANILKKLTYPHKLISIAFGEDCSSDDTLIKAKEVADDLRKTFPKVDVIHFNITGSVDGHWSFVHNKRNQLDRRGHLAVARNMLMKAALKDADWALWIDSDITYLPPDIIQQLFSSERNIVVPACLYRSDDKNLRVFDKNTWRETPESLASLSNFRKDELMLEGYGVSRRLFLTDLRAEGRVVPIDGVGGCTLLIKGDYHRKGLNFPEKVFENHIETEGLGKLAKKMGYGVYGMPFVEVMH